ncbi:MAG: hypothetical protein AB1Z98_19435 [Nannocystaceae bacterium]
MLVRSAPKLRHRGLALAVSLSVAAPAGLVLAPSSLVHAAPEAAAAAPAPAPAEAQAEDPALVEARALYDEGKARFDTFDYAGAVDSWTKAYAKLPDSSAGVRNAMVYNIATAQEKAYGIDKDLAHLRQAVMLLQSYVAKYKELYKRTPETAAEVQKAENRIAVLQERIARAERGEADEAAATPGQPAPTAGPTNQRFGSGEVDGIQWNTGHNPPPDPALVTRNRLLAQEEEKTDHMLIGAYVALSIGGVATLGGLGALLGASAAEAASPEDETAGRGARGAGWGTLAFGIAGLAAGTTLLIIGFQRRKKARDGTLIAGAPLLGPGLAGASFSVRF